MKLFDRTKLAVLGGALAIGALGGLTAGTSSAHAAPPQPVPPARTQAAGAVTLTSAYLGGSIPIANPERVYIEPWKGCSKPVTVTGANFPVSPIYGAGWVDLYREDTNRGYGYGTFVDAGPAQDWGGGVVAWQETNNPGPGTYYADISDIYNNFVWSGTVTFTC